MQPATVQQVDEAYAIQGHVQTRDSQARIPLMLPAAAAGETPMQYTNVIPQLTAQMSAMHLQPAGTFIPPQVSQFLN